MSVGYSRKLTMRSTLHMWQGMRPRMTHIMHKWKLVCSLDMGKPQQQRHFSAEKLYSYLLGTAWADTQRWLHYAVCSVTESMLRIRSTLHMWLCMRHCMKHIMHKWKFSLFPQPQQHRHFSAENLQLATEHCVGWHPALAALCCM